MLLFTKRYNRGLVRSPISGEQRFVDRNPLGNRIGINDNLKNRLVSEIKYIISSNKYIHNFLIIEKDSSGKATIHSESLKTLSLNELGYDITEFYDCRNLEIKPPKNQEEGLEADRFRHTITPIFFDLIELLIVFCKTVDLRNEFVKRLTNIFQEEGDFYFIFDYLVTTKQSSGLGSIITLLKDGYLKTNITNYFSSPIDDFNIRAQISAAILQNIFSSFEKGKTKDFTEELLRSVASRITDEANVDELFNILNQTVKNAKDLNNQISNIRHTDKYTIPVKNPGLFKLIANKNMEIVELVLFTLQEEYILITDSEGLKKSYLERYDLMEHAGWPHRQKTLNTYVPEIDIEDLGVQMPF